MKRILLLAVLPLMVLFSCKSQTLEEKTAQFESQIEEIANKFNEEYPALSEDQQKEYYDNTIAKIVALCKETIKKNKDNALAVTALKEAAVFMEPDEIIQVVESLKGEAAADPSVVKIKEAVAAKARASEGKPFVDFEVDGVKLSDFVGNGKVVLVDFWASWCVPCKREIPNIKAVYEQYGGEEFDVVSVAVWDKPEDTVAAAAEHGVVWNQIINAQTIASDAYGFDSIPYIILIGKDGTILKTNLRGSDIAQEVAKALGR